MKVSGIVLAGGHSSRMGRDKTLMSVNEETLIERTVKELSQAVDEIIIASNQRDKYKSRVPLKSWMSFLEWDRSGVFMRD